MNILKIILYLLLFLLVTFIIYWHTVYNRSKKEKNNYTITDSFVETLMYFIWGMYGSPIYFIIGVYGIKSKDFPDGP